jgi:hypothetical protein
LCSVHRHLLLRDELQAVQCGLHPERLLLRQFRLFGDRRRDVSERHVRLSDKSEDLQYRVHRNDQLLRHYRLPDRTGMRGWRVLVRWDVMPNRLLHGHHLQRWHRERRLRQERNELRDLHLARRLRLASVLLSELHERRVRRP